MVARDARSTRSPEVRKCVYVLYCRAWKVKCKLPATGKAGAVDAKIFRRQSWNVFSSVTTGWSIYSRRFCVPHILIILCMKMEWHSSSEELLDPTSKIQYMQLFFCNNDSQEPIKI
jgi:hypothetical protein